MWLMLVLTIKLENETIKLQELQFLFFLRLKEMNI